MGLFDIFKRKKEVSEQAKETEIRDMIGNKYPYFGALPDGTEYTLMDFEIIQRFQHRDGSITDAVMAKILRAGIDDTIIPDYADFISFEINPNQPVTTAICQKLIEGYCMCKGLARKISNFYRKNIRTRKWRSFS